ncbi:ABC transporter substrate-binding protein, partial [Rhizobium ruizarguesonis]
MAVIIEVERIELLGFAEGLSFPTDVSSATFSLRKEAKWADGQPVTPEDVVFSFD